jgi:radical SAM protein with 4Fe4S-binding SPASM domain
MARQIVIAANGDLFPCVLFMDPAYRLGNVADMSFAEAAGSRRRAQIVRELVTQRRETIPACADCDWKPFCQAGCPGIANMHHGAVDQPDDFCGYRKRTYERLVFGLVEERDRLAKLPAFEGA